MSSIAQAAPSPSSSERPTARAAANSNAGRMRSPPPRTLYLIASCRRAGTTSGPGSLEAKADSIRACHDSSWARKTSRPAGSFTRACRAPTAAFTPTLPAAKCSSRSLRPGGVSAFGRTVRALHVGHGDRGYSGASARTAVAVTVENGQIGSHRARHPRSQDRCLEQLERVAECVIHGRAFKPTVSHAVVAGGVAAHAVLVPLGVFHERLERRRIAFVGQQITRPLPTEQVVGRRAPWRALVVLVAGQEVQEQGRVVERPAGARSALRGACGPAALEDLAEQPLARAAAEEHILTRRMVVAVTRRNHDSFDAERHRFIEEGGYVIGILTAEQRAVDRYAKALAARQTDRGDRLVEHPFLADRLVMTLAAAVEVNRERQVRRRCVFVDVLGQQNCVGAQVDEFLARDDASDDLRHLLVDQRLTTRDGHHRCATFIHCMQRVFDAHPLLQRFLRIVDLAATGAREVALEQRLQHQYQRKALVAAQLLTGDVSPNFICLE